MAFKIVPKITTKGNSNSLSGISAGLARSNTGRLGIWLSVGRDVLGAMGWAEGSRVDLLWGDASDVGKIKIVSANPGSLKLRKSVGATPTLRLFTTRIASWCYTKTVRMAAAEYVIEDGALIVTLPPAMVETQAAIAKAKGETPVTPDGVLANPTNPQDPCGGAP